MGTNLRDRSIVSLETSWLDSAVKDKADVLAPCPTPHGDNHRDSIFYSEVCFDCYFRTSCDDK